MYVKLMNRSPEMSLEIRSCKVRRYAECTAVEPRQVPAGNRCSSVQAPPPLPPTLAPVTLRVSVENLQGGRAGCEKMQRNSE